LENDFKSQVEGRLHELFGKDEDPMSSMEWLRKVGEHPLKALKIKLLSIEWEITDSSMESLLSELRNLEGLYQDDQVVLTFLRLLGPIAKYIKVRKGSSHPRATVVLNSIYHGLERVALSEDMSHEEKEEILLQEVEKFRKLKEEVITLRDKRKQGALESAKAPRGNGRALEANACEVEPAKIPSQEFLTRALEEIKEVIRAEFKALRDDVKRWQESR
jgi:hypothetical protein